MSLNVCIILKHVAEENNISLVIGDGKSPIRLFTHCTTHYAHKTNINLIGKKLRIYVP